jgi:alpha-tubulin suppressor-like RCC1 family protein
LSLQNLTLESYNLGASIGDRVLVETNWTVEVKNGAGADIGMIGSYGTPLLDVTKVNESFAVERVFYEISAIYSSSYALDKNGKAWAWGLNSQGALGDNSNQIRRTPVKLAGATKTFCQIAGRAAIDKYGRAWAWGNGDFGSLGNGNELVVSLTPIKVYGNKTFCKITSNGITSLAIDKNGKAWGWGYNSGDRLNIGDGTNQNRSTPTAVAGNKTFCQISCSTHSLAIDKNGKAWGWGYNYQGQLGNGLYNVQFGVGSPVSVLGSQTFCKISAGNSHSAALDKYGKAWAWGGAYLGDNTISPRCVPVAVCGNRTFCHISASSHFLAIDKNGKAWGWGSNYYGQLGDNSTLDRLVPVSVYGSKTFCKIFAGGLFSLAIDKNGTTWSWGENTYGALGNNSITSRLTPVRVCNI